MKGFNFITIGIAAIIFMSCSGSTPISNSEVANKPNEKNAVGYVVLNDPLEEDLISSGLNIFTKECSMCHTLDTVRFFAPSLAGLSNRRSPEWIMNMILNVDVMLKNDSTAHVLLVENKIKMPDRQLTVDQARSVLEFFRSNDYEQLGTKDEAASAR